MNLLQDKLIDDFRAKYFKFWSVRLNLLASIAGALELANTFGMLFLPSAESYIPAGAFAALSVALSLAGLAARAIKQIWPEVEQAEQQREQVEQVEQVEQGAGK